MSELPREIRNHYEGFAGWLGHLFDRWENPSHREAIMFSARAVEEHTASGAHRKVVIPFPDWVPRTVPRSASALSEGEALRQLPDVLRALPSDPSKP